VDLQRAIDAGLQALDDGSEEAAAAALAPLVAANPQSARGWQVLGLLYRAQEASEPALAALGRARRLAPNDGLIANALAQVTLEAGLDAVREFEECLLLSPTVQVVQGMAAALAASARSGEAIALLDQTLVTQPQWGEGQWVLSRMRWMNGERDGYLAGLDRALAHNPQDPGLWRTRLAIRQRSLDFEGILADVPRALGSTGGAAFVRAVQAAALSELGRIGEADALFAGLAPAADLTDAIYRIRHLLRADRPRDAMALAEPLAPRAGAHIWPYLAVAWRLVGDRRWDWLERQHGLVRVYDISESIDNLPALAHRVRGMHEVSAEPLEQSVRGGTQTDGPLFARIEPEIRQLRAAICSAVRDHLEGLPPHDPGHPQLSQQRNQPIRFAGAWSIRLSGAGYHLGHVHPEGWFSSAFYLALPLEMGMGAAGNRQGWLSLGQPESSLGVDLRPFDYVEPKVGRLVLFPSTMWHATMPFAEGERLTVAFDVAPPRK